MSLYMKYIGTCCMCLSLWGVVQLALMGVFYHIETAILIEDVHAHTDEYTTFEGYINLTRKHYRSTARNCWMAAAAYGGTFLVSLCCYFQARSQEKTSKKLTDDDDLICIPPMPGKPIFLDSKLPTEYVYNKP